MTAVVLESEKPKMFGKNPVIDGEGKARHEVTPDILLDNAPPIGSDLNDPDGLVRCVEKLSTES